MSKNKVEIVYKKVAQLTAYAKNSRTHSDEQIAQLCKSIKEFGFVNPVLIDSNGVLIAGHGRVLAAKKLNIEDVPCIQLGNLTDTQRKALTIADNKIPMNAAWDMHMLKIELEDLQASGLDMELLAFTGNELSEIFAEGMESGGSSDDTVESPKERGEAISKLGDLWILGEHRLLCGSATDEKDFARLMDGSLASLVFTDPPYGVTYEGTNHDVIKNDELRGDDLCKALLVPAFKNLSNNVRDDAAFYIWHASSTRNDFTFAMQVASIVEKQYIMWIKPSFVMGHADYHHATEPCFYASKNGVAPKFYADRTQDTAWRVTFSDDKETATTVGGGLLLMDGEGSKLYIKTKVPKAAKVRNIRVSKGKALVLFTESSNTTAWEVGKDSTEYVHPTQKPIELALRGISNSSQPNEIVIDCFLGSGSGSTLIAAEKLGRRCFGMDLDPIYVDTIIHRWEAATGKQAKLNGRTFTDIALERGI